MNNWEIKKETLNQRCEICHQNDCFDAINNYCSRCKPVLAELKVLTQQPIFTPTRFTTLLDQRMESPGLLDLLINSISDIPEEVSNYITSIRVQGLTETLRKAGKTISNHNYKSRFYMLLFTIAILSKYLFCLLSAIFGFAVVLGIIVFPYDSFVFLLGFLDLVFIVGAYLSHNMSRYCWQFILENE